MNQELIVDNLDCFAEEFKKIQLHTQTIKKAEFEDCDFDSCDFSESFFHSCRFINCRFKNCNLSLIKLTNTIISGCEFESCKMIGIDWSMCDWKSLLSSEPMRFKESILNDNNFFGLNFDDMFMKECRVQNADFRSGSFKRANFSSTDFKGALFDNTHLESSDFTDATNTQIDLCKNHLKGAKFSRYEALFLLESMGILLE